LKLSIDDKKTKLEPIKKGVVFLGFKILSSKILLKKDTIKRFHKRIKKNLRVLKLDNVGKMVFVAGKFKN